MKVFLTARGLYRVQGSKGFAIEQFGNIETTLEKSTSRTCEENGHHWVYIGSAEDGTSFYRCRWCDMGVEEKEEL